MYLAIVSFIFSVLKVLLFKPNMLHRPQLLLKRFSSLLFTLLGLLLTPAFAQVNFPSDPEKFHLYILLGQSNMVGDNTVEAIDRQTNPRILMQNSNGTWSLAAEPLHGVGTGMGMAFARDLIQDLPPDVTIGLLPLAFGGTDIIYWLPGGAGWANSTNRISLAQGIGTFKGILWHQGESDSGTREQANPWQGRLLTLIDNYRQILGNENVPFLAGELGRFLSQRPGYGFFFIINDNLQPLPEQRNLTAVVSSAGLDHLGDNLHFSASTNRVFGRRYADEMRPLLARTDMDLGAFEALDSRWLRSWLGVFETSRYPWVFHLEHGFLYHLPITGDGSWYFDSNPGLGWWFAREADFPNIYSTTRSSWLYYYRGTQNPRLFYD